MPVPLAEIAELLGVAAVEGEPATGITHDSRAVRPGDLYVAFAGPTTTVQPSLPRPRRPEPSRSSPTRRAPSRRRAP